MVFQPALISRRCAIDRYRVRLGFEAPDHVRILRGELLGRKEDEP